MRTFIVVASLCFTTGLRAQVACGTVRWTQPVAAVESAKLQARLSAPRIAVGAREGFVIANEQPLSDVDTPTTFALAMWHFTLAAKDIAKPKFVRSAPPPGNRYHWPEPVVTADGTLHLTWGDDPVVEAGANPHTTLLSTWRGNFTGLWHASYQHGKWSKPERVARADEIIWNSTSHAIPVATSDGGFVTAAPAIARSSNSSTGEILVARWHSGKWSISRVSIHQTMAPAYVTIASQAKTLILGYITSTEGDAADENSVFVTRSTNDGMAWSSPILVRRSGAMPAYMPQLLALRDGSIGFVWNEGEHGQLDASILSYTRSTDHGLTWSAPIELIAPKQGDVRPTSDGCSRVLAVFERGTLPQMVMQTSYMDGGKWSAPATFAPDRTSVSPSIASDTNGCAYAVWNSIARDSLRASGEGVTSPHITYASTCQSKSHLPNSP